MRTFIREGFFPILFGGLLAALVLVVAHFKAGFDANRPRVITIERTPVAELLAETVMTENEDEGDDGIEAGPGLSWDDDSDPRYTEARTLAAKGDPREIQKQYEALFGKSLSSRALNDIAVLHLLEGEKEKALDYLNLAVRTTPVYPRSFFHRGLILSEMGLFTAAIKDYKAAIDELPFHFESRYNLALAYLKLGRLEEALDAFLKAAEGAAGEEKAMALYNAGVVAAKRAAKDEARRFFEEAIRLKPDYLKPRYGLASLEPHTPEGRQRAQAQFDLMINLRPNFAPTFFRLGRFHASFDDAPAAEKAYRKAIELYPEFSKARYNLGLLFLAQDRLEEARAQFQWLLGREPNQAGTHYNLGRIAFREKNYEAALVHYRQAVEARQGQYPEVYFSMGLLYAAQDQYDEAARAYELGLKYRKAWPEAHFNLGLAFLKQGKWSNAEKGFRQALQHNPRYAEAWYNLGVVYTRWDRDDDAIQAFRKALEIRPDYAAARLNLGVRYARNEQYAAAIREYGALLEKNDNYALAWYNLGLAHLKTDAPDQAEKAFRKALALEPDNIKALKYLAQALAAQKDYANAEKVLKRAVNAEAADPQLRVELARVHRKSGNLEEARKELKMALRLAPDDESIQQELDSLGAGSK